MTTENEDYNPSKIITEELNRIIEQMESAILDFDLVVHEMRNACVSYITDSELNPIVMDWVKRIEKGMEKIR